jgi:hypothetical protein
MLATSTCAPASLKMKYGAASSSSLHKTQHPSHKNWNCSLSDTEKISGQTEGKKTTIELYMPTDNITASQIEHLSRLGNCTGVSLYSRNYKLESDSYTHEKVCLQDQKILCNNIMYQSKIINKIIKSSCATHVHIFFLEELQSVFV